MGRNIEEKMITTSEFKNGMVIQLDEKVYTILKFQHVKPGKGPAFVRTKLQDINSGAIVDKTLRAGQKVQEIYIDRRKMEYLYRDGEAFVFMDRETYEQVWLDRTQLGDKVRFLKENTVVDILMNEGNFLGVEVPNSVELRVVKTEPGLKGDTATGGSKPAILETGLQVRVPLFISVGDLLSIDTRSGEYIERVKEGERE
jgi:elongation factor P